MMKVLVPREFQPSMLVSSNAVEAHPTWAIGTTYAKDDFVDYQTHIYQSLVNSNVAFQPDTNPTKWVYIGPDNTHAMFDNQVSTKTTRASDLIVTFAPGAIGSLWFGNLTGNSIEVTIRNGVGGPIVYQNYASLDGVEVGDWWEYFFTDPDQLQRTQVLFSGIPSYVNSQVEMKLSGTNVAIGHTSFGELREIGEMEMGAQAGFIDYSRKTTDQFGNTTFVKGANSRRLNCNVMVDRLNMNRVNRVMSQILSVPVVFVGEESLYEYEELIVIFGFTKDFRATIAYPTYSLCSFEIEGLI